MTDDRREKSFNALVQETILGDPRDLQAVVQRAMEGSELRCTRCSRQPTGFKTKKSAAMFHLLGVCQSCQDDPEILCPT